MNRVKDFLCNVDPVVLSLGILVALSFVVEIFLLGVWHFAAVVLGAVVLVGLVAGVGWLLYKFIVFAQSHC